MENFAGAMGNLDSNIKRINDKLQRLLKSYQLLQKENKKQGQQIKELQGFETKYKSEIETLQEKVGILKAAAGKMGDTDRKAFEKNINSYIREIDKCINIRSE